MRSAQQRLADAPASQALRRAADTAGYEGGFVEHYVIPVIYPEALTWRLQIVLGVIVVALNAVVYAFVWRKWKSRRREGPL